MKTKIYHPTTNKRKSKENNLEFVEVNPTELDYIQHNEIELTYELIALNTMSKNGLKSNKMLKKRLSLLKKGIKAYKLDNEMEIKMWREKNMKWLDTNSEYGKKLFPNRNLNYK